MQHNSSDPWKYVEEIFFLSDDRSILTHALKIDLALLTSALHTYASFSHDALWLEAMY